MATDENKGGDRAGRVVKLVIFASILILIGLPLGLWFAFEPVLGPILFRPQWKVDLDKGKAAWYQNQDEGEGLIKKALAEDNSASLFQRISMRRDYAGLLYDAGDFKTGDDVLQQAIDLAKEPLPSKSLEADMLTHAYQDRGWSMHKRWLKDHTLPDGVKDQEMSVAVAAKYFGDDDHQTVYKLGGLALLYSNVGLKDKAKETFDRALKDTEKTANAAEAKWFIYAMLARAKAAQHDYAGGVEAYIQSLDCPTPSESTWRAWEEFRNGLDQGQPEHNPELKAVRTMLSKEQFDDLDKLADKLRVAQTAQPDGSWVLDAYYDRLANGDHNMNLAQFKQRLLELKKWHKERPKSVTARVAIADCLKDYAWFARGDGESDTVTDEGWRLFEERLIQARNLLDEDHNVRQECPVGCYVYSVLMMARDETRKFHVEFFQLSDDCHNRWPAYRTVDKRGCYALLPRWRGSQGEWVRYAAKTANRLPGAQGDALYAQMIYYTKQFFDNIFADEPAVDWNKTKRGCKQIIKDFPNDMRARKMMFDLACVKGDRDAMKEAFE